jgi:hypothetical protein
MAEKPRIKSVFGIIHPFYGAEDEPGDSNPAEESEFLLKKWKDVIDRVAPDPSAALMIDYIPGLKGKHLQTDLLDYAKKKVGEDRLFINREEGLPGKPFNENRPFEKNQVSKKFGGKLSRDARLFLCGEYLVGCVLHRGKIFARETGIKRTVIMPDSSTIIFGGLSGGNLTPPVIQKMSLKERKLWLKATKTDFRRKYSRNVLAPTNQRTQKKVDAARGFCGLPKENWRRRK